MTKKEADTIVTACKKYGITTTINKIVDDYSVVFINRIEFNSIEGAKLMVNALVIEKRLKDKKHPPPPPKPAGDEKPLNFNRYYSPKHSQKGTGNWSERHLQDPNQPH